MRDLMTTEAADRVADELHEEVMPTKEKVLQMEVTDLWKDTTPFWASQITKIYLWTVRSPSQLIYLAA